MKNITQKKVLSINKNYLTFDDKNDIYIIKAITSQEFINRKKDYVSLNRQNYRSSLTEISGITFDKNKKRNSINKTFNRKMNKNKDENEHKNKKSKLIEIPKYLKTYTKV